ncbi:MAG: hypothetical protein QW057_09155 [Candidatus Bathyarchaeia archaeon]
MRIRILISTREKNHYERLPGAAVEWMAVSGKACVNCANVKVRKGELYCGLLKQKVSEKYKCGRFKAR